MSGPSGNQFLFFPSNTTTTNNNNRLYLKRVKHLNSSPKTLMTLWPSKQIANIDSTAKNYEIYYFQR